MRFGKDSTHREYSGHMSIQLDPQRNWLQTFLVDILPIAEFRQVYYEI